MVQNTCFTKTIIFVSVLTNIVTGCAKTDPATTPVATQCCSLDIADTTSTGRFLFNPALVNCPTQTAFICSIHEDGSTSTTRILVNGQEVASVAQGQNSMIDLVCDKSDLRWKYMNTLIVNDIRCDV